MKEGEFIPNFEDKPSNTNEEREAQEISELEGYIGDFYSYLKQGLVKPEDPDVQEIEKAIVDYRKAEENFDVPINESMETLRKLLIVFFKNHPLGDLPPKKLSDKDSVIENFMGKIFGDKKKEDGV